MESPISPIVANLYMEDFEIKAISTAEHPSRFGRGMWMTLLWSLKLQRRKDSWSTSTVLIHTSNLEEMTGHSFRFYVKADGSIPFLDTIVMSQPDNSLLISVYRKLLKEEEDHLNRALRRCKYPEWALSRANIKQKKRTNTN